MARDACQLRRRHGWGLWCTNSDTMPTCQSSCRPLLVINELLGKDDATQVKYLEVAWTDYLRILLYKPTPALSMEV